MTSTTSETIREWGAAVDSAAALGQALDLSPCDTLHVTFPAIVGDDETMGALAALLDPVIDTVEPFVAMGAVPGDAAGDFVHAVYHLLQTAAGLGHMLGVADAMGMADSIPDLDDIAWGDLPTLEDLTTTATPDDEGSESEES